MLEATLAKLETPNEEGIWVSYQRLQGEGEKRKWCEQWIRRLNYLPESGPIDFLSVCAKEYERILLEN